MEALTAEQRYEHARKVFEVREREHKVAEKYAADAWRELNEARLVWEAEAKAVADSK